MQPEREREYVRSAAAPRNKTSRPNWDWLLKPHSWGGCLSGSLLVGTGRVHRFHTPTGREVGRVESQ
jgi:hypothetical protein